MPLWLKLIFGGLGAILVAGSVAWYAWASDRVAEAKGWPGVQGTVVATRVEETRNEIRDSRTNRFSVTYSYQPVIDYTYRVGGRQYASNRIWLADGRAWENSAEAQAFLSDYPERGPVSVVYNPADPSDAALIVQPPTPLIFIVTAMGLILLALAWFYPRKGPDRPVVPAWAARDLLRNRRRH